MEKIKNFVQTKKFKVILAVLAGLIVVLTSFQFGVFVGYRKASFSYGLGDNYYRTFGGRGMTGRDFDRGFMMMDPRGGFPDAHGTIGRVISVNLPTFVVQDQAGVEKIVRLSDSSSVMSFREKVDPKNIIVDSFIAVIGTPNNDSEIEAKLVRIMPSNPPVFIQSTTTPKQ